MDIQKLRQDTPGTANMIHLNNAGASLMPEPVFKSLTNYLSSELHTGGYETADKYSKELEDFYKHTATLINAESNEIAFMENATYAWDMAFYSIPFNEGDRILTSKIEYASNFIAYLQMKKGKKIQISVVESLSTGEVDPDALEKELRKGNVKLVSITHIPTNGGIVNPAEDIGFLANKYGVMYLLDACQSAGQYPLDVKKINCSFLSATGRKYLRGPRGTGFLYVNNDLIGELEPASLDLHSATWTTPDSFEIRKDARRFEKWETNFAGKFALSVAIQYLLDLGVENVWQRVQLLANYLRDSLSNIPGIEVLDLGSVRSGIVSLRSAKMAPATLKQFLKEKGINTSVLVANTTLLDMEERSIDSAIRASVHYYNTEEELDRLVDILRSL